MPEIEERQTMAPPAGNIASMANLHVSHMPRPSTAITRSQSSTVDSSTSPSGMMPAFATSTSSRPKWSTAAWIMRRASSTTETSPVTVSTSAPEPRKSSASASSGASWISVMTSRAPSWAKRTAVARPIP
jgi:hypothetical protein